MVLSCDMEPPAEIMSAWRVRKDGQIMGLEILFIALGKHLIYSLVHTLFL